MKWNLRGAFQSEIESTESASQRALEAWRQARRRAAPAGPEAAWLGKGTRARRGARSGLIPTELRTRLNHGAACGRRLTPALEAPLRWYVGLVQSSLGSVRDYKRAGDGDTGPLTAGMGACAPKEAGAATVSQGKAGSEQAQSSLRAGAATVSQGKAGSEQPQSSLRAGASPLDSRSVYVLANTQPASRPIRLLSRRSTSLTHAGRVHESAGESESAGEIETAGESESRIASRRPRVRDQHLAVAQGEVGHLLAEEPLLQHQLPRLGAGRRGTVRDGSAVNWMGDLSTARVAAAPAGATAQTERGSRRRQTRQAGRR